MYLYKLQTATSYLEFFTVSRLFITTGNVGMANSEKRNSGEMIQ
jgi:hypothetical protein